MTFIIKEVGKKNSKKIVFCGSDEIALPMLHYLSSLPEISICGFLTQPDRRTGRGRKLKVNAIKEWAIQGNFQVKTPSKPGFDEISWLREIQADLVLVMAYGHLLADDFLNSTPLGCFNLHASLLPAYRGASPIETSLACGDQTTGVTLMRMVRKMDAGPIIDQQSVAIEENETGLTLRKKIGDACIPLTKRNLESLLTGKICEKKQMEEQVTYCRKLVKGDALLDFTLPAKLLECRSRAFQIWPGSIFIHDQMALRLGRCEVLPKKGLAPGEIVVEENKKLVIGTAEGSLRILELQKPGGRMMPVADFLRGYSIKSNSRVQSVPHLPLVSKKFA